MRPSLDHGCPDGLPGRRLDLLGRVLAAQLTPVSRAMPTPSLEVHAARVLLFECFLVGCLASIATQFAGHRPATHPPPCCGSSPEGFWQYFSREGIVYLWWSLLPFYVIQLPVLAASLGGVWYLLGELDVAKPVRGPILVVTGTLSALLPIAAVHHLDWNWNAVFLGAGTWAGARAATRYRRSGADGDLQAPGPS